MNKKNITTLVVVVIVLVLIVMVFIKVKDQKNKQIPLTPAEMEINKAVTSNTTQEIKTSIDNINVDDLGLDEDLKNIDSELEKL